MKKLLATFISLFLLSVSLNALEGTYSVSGYDPYDKTSYTGTLVITKDKNNVYQGSWTIMQKGQQFQFSGTGLKNGDDVSFAYMSDTETGLQMYKKNGKALEGPFVRVNNNLVGNEKCVMQ